MSDLYRLVYASKNFLQGSDAEIAQAVSQILDASQRNNAQVDVTGALMFNAGAFAQVLEGPKEGVESTFERIQCDPRHGDVTVLQCGPTESRSFANWSMAFVGQSQAGRARWEGIAATSGFDLSRLDGDAVFGMLHGLVLDEEGLPVVASTTQEPQKTADTLTPGLNVDRVRSELSQTGQARQPLQDAPSMPIAELPTEQLRRDDMSERTAKPDAALTILRAALAKERQLTTELRNELDEVRISLAVRGEQLDVLRQDRDLWAKRAELLATLISHEAHEVMKTPNSTESEASAPHGQNQPSASIRVVA